MASTNLFHFKGGVTQTGPGGSAKFLLFLLNGNKEVSLFDAKKYAFVENPRMDSVTNWSPDDWLTDCPVVKIFMQEQEFGKAKFQQAFYLALGAKLDKQVVTIKPRSLLARGLGYEFRAEAKFLKKSEVLTLLAPESIGYKVLLRQSTPPTQVLREIITIQRHGPSHETVASSHGAVRHLRIHK